MVSAHDVAAYILKKQGAMSAMKLEKLVYYCQAWSLVWDERPLFRERIEAWRNGPVVPELYDKHRGQYEVSKWKWGNPEKLDRDEKMTVNAVLKHYAKQSAFWLSQLTHNEEPWRAARAGLPDDENSNNEITHEAMGTFYRNLTDK